MLSLGLVAADVTRIFKVCPRCLLLRVMEAAEVSSQLVARTGKSKAASMYSATLKKSDSHKMLSNSS